MKARHQVVIIGGGFAGLHAAQHLKRADVDVTVLDRRNFHLFQPLLYQVATAGLSPANIAAPLRSVLKRQRNTRVLMAEVTGIDADQHNVILKDGSAIHYDTLIVATGARHDYFGQPQWEQIAPSLKTLEDAIKIRHNIFVAFEIAERETDPGRIRQLLTFVIVGAGPTGVELAGALAEITRDTLKANFRSIEPSDSRIILLDAGPRVLPAMHPSLSEKAHRALQKLGIDVRVNTRVTDLQDGFVKVQMGGKDETIHAQTVLWAAGVRASKLGLAIGEATGAKTDRAGRVIVNADLSVPNHPEILVLGDLASFSHTADGKPLPGVATVAMQHGDYAAALVKARLKGKTMAPFKYFNKGSMATIGRASAVADVGGWKFSGYPAWLLWLFIHLMYIVAYANRVLVLIQWAWNYFTFGRAARLITNDESLPGPPVSGAPAETKGPESRKSEPAPRA
jgi:NADH dehydrogenase